MSTSSFTAFGLIALHSFVFVSACVTYILVIIGISAYYMHILNGYSVMSLSWWQLNFNCGNEKHRCWKQMVGIGEV